jgi:MoxR-like ATPase
VTAAAATPEAIQAAFDAEGFVCSPEVSVALFLAETLKKPLLLEGPPGVGKTEIAKLWARLHEMKLVRLQCYEGLDESKALYEWSYGKQMLYTQLLREKLGDVLGGAGTIAEAMRVLRGQADAFFSPDFLLERPLLQAVRSPEPVVLLIDEVDRSDEEFEAFLLEVLSEQQVSVPELGTLRARHPLRAVLTSNDSRDLSDALRRRCLYLYIDYPSAEEEERILDKKAPGLDASLRQRVVRFVQAVRKAGLGKAPGIAETVDWALALAAVGATGLGAAELKKTLGALLKNREDLAVVLADPGKFR